MSFAPARVLLIDPHEQVRSVMASQLQLGGHVCIEAADGVEAARSMRYTAPDVVFVDVKVPLGGHKVARLLRLNQRYREIPFVIMGPEAMLSKNRCAAAAGGVGPELPKPCTARQLGQVLEAALAGPPPRLTAEDVRRELAEVTDVPVLKSIHRRAMTLLGVADADVNLPELARTIELDHGLTTMLLRICRSAYYGFRGNTVGAAVTFLGVEKLRKIAQAAIVYDAIGLQRMETTQDGFDLMGLWKHCLACGLIMEAGGHRVKGRDHFIAGMLHDIGKLVLCLRFPQHFAELLRIARDEDQTFYQAESELMGLTHADIGYEVVRRWGLPSTIATAIAYHHQPAATLQHRRLTQLVHLADILARSLEIGHAGDRHPTALDPAARSLARYVLAVASQKEELVAQVDSLVSGVVSTAQGATPCGVSRSQEVAAA